MLWFCGVLNCVFRVHSSCSSLNSGGAVEKAWCKNSLEPPIPMNSRAAFPDRKESIEIPNWPHPSGACGSMSTGANDKGRCRPVPVESS